MLISVEILKILIFKIDVNFKRNDIIKIKSRVYF